MEPRRITLGLIAFALFGFLLYWFVPSGTVDRSEESSTTKVQSDTSPRKKKSPEQSLTNFRLVETTESGEEWILVSPSATRHGDTVELRSPKVRYLTDSETRAVITAREGSYSFNENSLSLTGEVVIERTKKNQFLHTQSLQWNMKKDTVSTSDSVRMTLPQGVLQAVGMKVNLREERLQFLSSVKITSK